MEANVRKMTALYMFVSGIAILLMMVLGLLMLLAQGKMIPLGQDTFYEMMTAHGTFMVERLRLLRRRLCGTFCASTSVCRFRFL
ncbi:MULTISPECIES: hypothetical protein [Geobacillus]|uniref:hypothetical protein n=1 Tax=Geobacillus TaxID=129337 RepID=UPI00030F673B|nr:hypothetical protein [Geobacillus thermoleovorans]